MALERGACFPLGASVSDEGVNFAVYSEHATAIELCVFDEHGEKELQRLRLHGPEDGLFHGLLTGARAGLIYGYRAHGPYEPHQGHRFNPHKLLLDPYARLIVGQHQWSALHQAWNEADQSIDERDNAALALKAKVVAPDTILPTVRPIHQRESTVIYEVHVRGFSMSRPDLPEHMRGCYAALAHERSIAYFKSLGVTSLCLLPVQYHLDEPHLVQKRLSNYWGYNTLGFFAADPRYAHKAEHAKDEFQYMVKALHEAGIEVLLDVVYNHTPEGDEQCATLAFKGMDNATWYRLSKHKEHYLNDTGCGNTLNVAHPRVTQFVLDSLRYWVEVMGVDGFRFDLATVLGRSERGFSEHAAFFTALLQDPVLAPVKLIAEPWDAGEDGYKLGEFPSRFMEWNDQYRDVMRRYWLQGKGDRALFVRRFMASSDIFHKASRQPASSINYIAVHDGYTLRDMVSYEAKHNHANGEDNRDGRDAEPACNFGVEGASDDAQVLLMRRSASRALMATMLLSQGTPMLCAGDEMGRTQQGNNNAYCQDNAISWLDWQQPDDMMLKLVQALTRLRREYPVLRHRQWFDASSGNHYAMQWMSCEGYALSHEDWHATHDLAIAVRMTSKDQPDLYLGFNPHAQERTFHLPQGAWRVKLDTADEAIAHETAASQYREQYYAKGMSVYVLVQNDAA